MNAAIGELHGDGHAAPNGGARPVELTLPNVVPFLIERGLLEGRATAGGSPVVCDFSSRNRNFRIVAGGRGLFVKQARDMRPDNVLMLEREAACYELARSDEALGRLMPVLLMYDPQNKILVTELSPEAGSLVDRHTHQIGIPPEFGARLGAIVGRQHARSPSEFERRGVPSPFPRRIPNILALGRLARESSPMFGPFGPEISAFLRLNPKIERLLNEMHDEWRFECLMHGDMTWNNIVAFPLGSPSPEFRIVDWEMADFGDPGWDIGTVLQGFLAAWLMSRRTDGGARIAPPSVPMGQPMPMMQPLSLAFWSAYSRARAFDAARSRSELERDIRFAALRLVWAVLWRRPRPPPINPSALEVIKANLGLLLDPRTPATALLGE